MLLEPTIERPSSELGRGEWAAPPWVIVTIGIATVVFVTVVLTIVAVLRARARRAGDAPISSRTGSIPPRRPGP